MENTEVTYAMIDSTAPGSFALTELDSSEVGDATGAAPLVSPRPNPPTGAAPLVTGAGVEPRVQVPAASAPGGDGLPVYDTIRT
jgi:hypothetical protein